MSNLRQAAERALDALEDIFGKNKVDVGAINALRAALDEPDQEPVAWINWNAATGKRSVSFVQESELASEPLYTTSNRRVPLSDGWILGMWPDTGFPLEVLKFARAIERAHGIGGKE